MKCPNCQTTRLSPKSLRPDLQVLECGTCGGYWLQSFQYWTWKEKNPDVAKSASSEIEPQVSDSIKSKRCPECNKNLYRSLVGHGTKISIERCETCRGYWFDKNEWELLESRDIVGEIHKIFSSDWQKQARLEEIAARKEQQLKTEIGGEHFRKVDEFRKWLNGFEKKEAVWAFLNYQR